MSGSKLKLNEIYAELSDLIGYENTIKVYEQYKGQQINFPVNLYDMLRGIDAEPCAFELLVGGR